MFASFPRLVALPAVCAILMVGLTFSPGTAAAQNLPPQAPSLFGTEPSKTIPNQYIVVFKENTARNVIRRVTDTAVRDLGAKVLYEYSSALKGFAAKLSKKALRQLRKDDRVAYIEPDKTIKLSDESTQPYPLPLLNTDQTGATWGLDRIDQRNLPLNSIYIYTSTGTGVNAYVIDTGIRTTHSEFGGRASGAYTAISDGNSTNDCNGHGTHVAGTIGGATYGVAKNVKLYAVRVLGCNGSGSTSGVIAGVDWVRQNRVLPAVANMSLVGGASTALDSAVTNAINAGVVFAIAAGNSTANACNYSPARAAAAITVGATTSSDARASYSNYGTCLDLFAPGSGITSAWITNDTATNTISGTSMATPHVAGVAALYLQTNPGASAAAVRDAIVNNATANKVTSPGTGSPNKLLYSLFGAPPSPSATPTRTSTNLPPTPTRTATLPSNATATPTRTATPNSGGTNVVVNPGFESGPSVGWSQYSSGGYEIIDKTRPRTGAYSAYECYYDACTEYIEQQLTVPANATLTYYWYQISSEGTATAYDYLRVQVYSTGGSLLGTLRTWSNRNQRNVWSLDTLSLAAYGGQTVKLRFIGTTDSSLRSAYWIDDVSVK